MLKTSGKEIKSLLEHIEGIIKKGIKGRLKQGRVKSWTLKIAFVYSNTFMWWHFVFTRVSKSLVRYFSSKVLLKIKIRTEMKASTHFSTSQNH